MKHRLAIELEDRLRYSRVVRGALCRWKLATAPAANGDDPQSLARAIDHLCLAARLAASPGQLLGVEARIAPLAERLGSRRIDWKEFEPEADSRRIQKAAVLKPFVGEREKGVVFVSFESQWVRLLANCDVREFTRRYTLVVSPVWASPHGLVNYALPRQVTDYVVSIISDPKDREAIPRLSGNYVTVPLLCSNWVNPACFQPVPFGRKDIDILMVANFGKYKRHHALFKALREMPRSLKVVLVGQRNGSRTREALLAEAAAYGVEDRIQLRQSVPEAELFDTLARAKISLILSMREGSCVAVVESMFAGTPVGLFAGAEVGSRQFLNPATGRFLQPGNLARQLMQFLADASTFQPRRWVEANGVDCLSSSATLNAALKQAAISHGHEWTQDIAPLHWRPDPLLVHPADRERLIPAHEDIQSRFGIQIG